MNLFVFSHSEEYLTQDLLRQVGPRSDWRCLTTREFIKEVEIDEHLSQSAHTFSWRHRGDEILKSDGSIFLDRIFSFESCHDLFRDAKFASLESDALLFYLRSSSIRHRSTVLHGTPGAWSMPLTSQWAVVRQTIPGLFVPRYECPFNEADTELNLASLVTVDFASTHHWRPGCYHKSNPALAFERPAGQVVSILATPKAYLPAQNCSPEAGWYAMQVCATFGIWFGEVLLFEEKGGLTFGMVSPQPSKLFRGERVEKFMRDQLQLEKGQ